MTADADVDPWRLASSQGDRVHSRRVELGATAAPSDLVTALDRQPGTTEGASR